MKYVLLPSVMLLAAFATCADERDGVLAKLKGGQIDTLIYDEKEFSVLLNEMIESKDNEESLVSAYHSLGKTDVYLKHTLLIVLIKKQTRDLYSNDGRQKAKAVLVEALKDEHFWVRKEAVWGLRFFGDTSEQLLGRDILPLVRDKSEHVRKEAMSTFMDLIELQKDIRENVF